jgi:beta-glucosidase
MTKLDEAILNIILVHIKCTNPGAPTIQRWKEVITTISNEANKTRLKIPVLYGIDAISWFQLIVGATLFHNK